MSTCFAQTSEQISLLNEAGQLNIQEAFIASQPAATLRAATGNSVFINQVGTGNFASVQATSSQSSIEIDQNGVGNFVDLDYTASQIDALVVQSGNNNSFTDFSLNPVGDAITTSISQIGNNLRVEKFGSNSISNGLEINMTGSFKTIVVNSF